MTAAPHDPPRWPEFLLRRLLRPTDRESTTGDLLEEYRVAREPALGRLRAKVWYCRQALGFLWRAIWPEILVLAMFNVFLAMTAFRPGHHAPHEATAPTLVMMVFRVIWYGSVVGTPGVSMLDAALYFVVAYRAAVRTGLVITGVLVAAATSVVAMIVLFVAAATITPGLAVALVRQPLLVLILSVYVVVPLAYSALFGQMGGCCGRWHIRSAINGRLRRDRDSEIEKLWVSNSLSGGDTSRPPAPRGTPENTEE
jgi:hypothetical protein